MTEESLVDRLRHVYWLGGGSGAGKSTIAQRLADDFGLRVYASDEVMADHARRTSAEAGPNLAAFQAMDMDQRWVNRSPEDMLETFSWFRGEGFDLIVEDLVSGSTSPVVVEGFRLLPHRVAPLTTYQRCLWLLPTPAFRRAAFAARSDIATIVRRTSDPQRALDNLLSRDEMFTDRLRTETAALRLRSISIDTGTDVDVVTVTVAAHFGLTG